MESWREELYASELFHFGVKGMRWRKRKNKYKDFDSYDGSGRGLAGNEMRKEKKLHWYLNLNLPNKPKRASKFSGMTKLGTLGTRSNRKCSSLRRSREGSIGRSACKKLMDAVGHERLKGRYLYL